ncbi:hypothetical protein Avbf_15556 [Armadillidium vulgare]|nr:hypothetical protein Avbf_15556 [Armadillidium vulgare]
MNFKIKDLIYIWLLLLVQNAENRPLSCYVIDEKFGSMLCCRVSAGNSNCRTLIPKNTFQFVKTWPLETVRHANLLLRRFHKKEAEDSEFSSQFVSSDSFRREQIEEERKILEAIISEENEKKCCCERVKEIIIPNEGYSYDKDSHKIYQELPDRVQVAMSVSCISSNCTQNFKKFSCSKASAYVPLYVIDKEFPDYLQEVPIEVNKDCICEEEYIDHSQHVPTQNFKKELFKRFAKYDKINSRQINQELDNIRSVMKNNLYRSHNVNNTFKLFEDVVKNFNHTYIKAAGNIKFVNKTNNKYEENFFDAASLILIATKLLNFNISYSDSTSKETASSGDWDISSRNTTDNKLSSETYAQSQRFRRNGN